MNKKRIKIVKLLIMAAFCLTLSFKAFICFFPVKYREEIEKYSGIYGIDQKLVYAVINTESGFDPASVSHKGASGLMQIMKPTADWAAEQIGIEDYSYDRIYEPDININIGCWLLHRLSDIYDNDIVLICAAYNAGMGNVAEWLSDSRFSGDGKTLSVIPFDETKKYVAKVTVYSKIYGIILSCG